MAAKNKASSGIVGWREWVGLPELGIDRLRAKVDTGALTSAIHAFEIEVFGRKGRKMARFCVHPLPDEGGDTLEVIAPMLEYRQVRNSGGTVTERPCILTPVRIGASTWPIELTLVSRAQMRFRMLLGRQAIAGRYLVDVEASYVQGVPRTKRA